MMTPLNFTDGVSSLFCLSSFSVQAHLSPGSRFVYSCCIITKQVKEEGMFDMDLKNP